MANNGSESGGVYAAERIVQKRVKKVRRNEWCLWPNLILAAKKSKKMENKKFGGSRECDVFH